MDQETIRQATFETTLKVWPHAALPPIVMIRRGYEEMFQP